MFLAPTTHVGSPPAICKVGMYVLSAHPMYGELLVLTGIREYSHSIKEATGKPKKKTRRKTNNKMQMLRKKKWYSFRMMFLLHPINATGAQ
jgi:hypothetical protein